MELCANGSLFHRLQDVAHTLVNWPRVLKWGYEIVLGIAVLHNWTPVILHRDLKTLNLLVRSNIQTSFQSSFFQPVEWNLCFVTHV